MSGLLNRSFAAFSDPNHEAACRTGSASPAPQNRGALPILLGMAFLADEPTDIDELDLNANEWLDVVRVVTD